MNSIDITFERGLRIWWSYTWRAFLLLLPVVLLMMLLLPEPPPAATEGRADPMAEPSGGNMLIWLVIMPLNVIMQVQALRWMLKTRWREFRLEALPVDSSDPAPDKSS